jgi:hypothetical protein
MSKETQRRWRQANPEKERAIRQRSYIKNKEKRNAADRAYYRANKAKVAKMVAARRCLWQYGITLEQKATLLADQGGVCAICKSPHHRDRDWNLDHDHNKKKGEPGFIRGVLCRHCNMCIGHALEDPLRLRLAAEYLERQR